MTQGDRPTNPQDELEEALRQLEQRQRRAAQRSKLQEVSTEEVSEAVRQIAVEQKEEKARRARKPSFLARAKWPLLSVLSALAVIVCIAVLWPKPLPPPATSATAAVQGFWAAVIKGDYRGATVYYPALIERYGSREQAAQFLKRHFSTNPPTVVRNVVETGTKPDSLELIVTYEVVHRSGSPTVGQAVVVDTKDPKQGFVIVGGI